MNWLALIKRERMRWTWLNQVRESLFYWLWRSERLWVPFVVVQLLSHVRLFASPWTATYQAPRPSHLLEFSQIHQQFESVILSNHLILCHPFLPLPSVFHSIRVFSNESTRWIRWPKLWNFSFSFSPSNEYSGLIFFEIDWFDLPAVQGTLKSLL